jgi:hypothetical protein
MSKTLTLLKKMLADKAQRERVLTDPAAVARELDLRALRKTRLVPSGAGDSAGLFHP